ncbi:penicillin-binding transpeptidase domain-containing protein [Streptomyces buecherae]|uniref:penicillin-binding transpeptidase domain-containing protein n=1 Tax=Streptomyces buecherae TaxID=2763006 RepID=UPI003659EFE5
MRTYRAGRRRRRAGVAAAIAAVLVAGGGTWAVAEWNSGDGGGTAGGAREADPRALHTARAFLDHWAAGDLTKAAALTDAPERAETTLRNFTAGLDIERPSFVAKRATADGDDGASVPFAAKLPINGLGTWQYRSALPLVRADGGAGSKGDRDGGGAAGWRVRWELGLVHPKLTDEAKFRLVREDGTPDVLDRDGGKLSGTDHPSVAQALGVGGGKPRGAVQLIDRDTDEVRGTEARFGGPTSARGPVRTTIDPAVQRAAERALERHAKGRNAGLVALRIADGEVVAVANTPAGGFNRAFLGTYAPGSTMKVITSAALLNKGVVAPNDVVDCPKYLTVGKQFHNVETSEIRGATFREDFIHSCNTAFVSLRDKLGDRELTEFSSTYFGIGQEWFTGAPSFDGEVPVPGDETEKSAALFGQGKLRANPLVMASATATAASGTFRMPLLVREGGTAREGEGPRTEKLPSDVVRTLRSLMRDTVTDGTAKVLADLPGEVGAKTGTAEVTEEGPNNGWLVAYDDEIAIACVVEGAQHGSDSAGPVIHDVLAATD